MKPVLSTLAVLLLANLAASQTPVTQTAVLVAPATQANSAAATLAVNAVVQAPGELPSPAATVLGPGSSSTTLAYVTVGSTPFPTPGSISLMGSLNGSPNAACALALSSQIGSNICGGFAGAPCMTGPLLFGSALTPFGLYHLDLNPIMIIDGISGLAPPAFLNANGTLPLSAVGVVNTTTNGGIEQNFAIQGAVVDPTSVAGVSLTACMTVNQWVYY